MKTTTMVGVTVHPILSPIKAGDMLTMNVAVRPKWWQFWAKPRLEERVAVVTSVVGGEGFRVKCDKGGLEG